ncbi:MAG TPA: hypothetical protein VK509_03095, partial [Polyangiales bacterium]|nr:hypothetical protein [Polyangiales bacterium]
MVALFSDSNPDFFTDVRNNATAAPGPDGKPDAMIGCDSNSGTGGSSLLNANLPPGRYHVVVRSRLGALDPDDVFNISIHDTDSSVSSVCDATDVGGQAVIRQMLQPGTYWVAMSGKSGSTPDSGAYSLRMRDYGPIRNGATLVAPAPQTTPVSDPLCSASAANTVTANVVAGQPYYVVVKGATAADRGRYKLTVENLQAAALMGCNAEASSPDAFYKFSLSTTTDIEILVEGQGGSTTTLDPVIAVYSASAAFFGTNYALSDVGVPVPCDDDGGAAFTGIAGSSHIGATMPAGDYYLVVKGKGAASAWGATDLPFLVSIRDRTGKSAIDCAPATGPDPSKIVADLAPGDYRLVVSGDDPTGGAYEIDFKDLSASLNKADRVGCGVGSLEVPNLVPNNPYYLVVKGDAGATAGSYGMTVETLDGAASNIGCNADFLSPDAFFKFNVTQQTEVVVDTADSIVDTVIALYPGNTTTFGTNNYARDAFNTTVACNDDFGGQKSSQISATLAPGSYYVVVKGKATGWPSSSMPFNLSIRDDGNSRAITCADDVGAGSPKIVQSLPAGDYLVVLSDTDPESSPAAGGAYSITFRDVHASGGSGLPLSCGQNRIDGGDANGDLKPDGIAVQGGRTYYVVLKGNANGDEDSYRLTVDDVVSTQAGAGSAAIACAGEGSSVDAVYPEGDYYALVSGPSNTKGPYDLVARDVDPFADYNRVACDDDSGPNGTSVIEAELEQGMHYVVLKGDGAGQAGSYHLNVRDVDARADNRMACADADTGETLSYDVVAGQDYTVLLKGDARSQQGPFNIKLYDELGLQSGGGQLVTCKTICPNIAPYNCKGVGVLAGSAAECCSQTRQLGRCTTSGTSSCLGAAQICNTDGQCCSGTCVRPLGALLGAGTCSNQQCAPSELAPASDSLSFTQTLSYDTHYMTVKGRRANEKGFYEVQVGDPAQGSATTTYAPPTWTEVSDALENTGAKVLPVVSCTGGTNNGRCNGTIAQARALAKQTGAVDTDVNSPTLNQGITAQINPDGSGIGASLAESVRDLASYLSMDITVSVVNNPGFVVAIQKCTNKTFPEQTACTTVSSGCDDTSAVPKNTVKSCRPGAVPKFLVSFTNPAGPSPPPVPPNDPTLDPNGGYHFKLQIVGDHQYLLDEVPVYIIPTGNMGPPPPPSGTGTFVPMGSYEQVVFGAGCGYYQTEGESVNPKGEGGSVANCSDGDDNDGDGQIDSRDRDCDSCRDGSDNDGDGLTDRGVDQNGDGDFVDPGESGPEPGCFAGSCNDGNDDDNDSKKDLLDPNCA